MSHKERVINENDPLFKSIVFIIKHGEKMHAAFKRLSLPNLWKIILVFLIFSNSITLIGIVNAFVQKLFFADEGSLVDVHLFFWLLRALFVGGENEMLGMMIGFRIAGIPLFLLPFYLLFGICLFISAGVNIPASLAIIYKYKPKGWLLYLLYGFMLLSAALYAILALPNLE